MEYSRLSHILKLENETIGLKKSLKPYIEEEQTTQWPKEKVKFVLIVIIVWVSKWLTMDNKPCSSIQHI
jgi:hypothetical protein